MTYASDQWGIKPAKELKVGWSILLQNANSNRESFRVISGVTMVMEEETDERGDHAQDVIASVILTFGIMTTSGSTGGGNRGFQITCKPEDPIKVYKKYLKPNADQPWSIA